MKVIRILLMCCYIVTTSLVFGQRTISGDLPFALHRVYPPLSIDKLQIKTANSLLDLNPHFEKDWVHTYRSVSVTTNVNGKSRTVIGKSDLLTDEQKDLLNNSDKGSSITVEVEYIPNNSLKHKEKRHIDFTLTVLPASDASYPKRMSAALAYFAEAAINRIPTNTFKDYDLAAITFSISESGEIEEPKIFWSSSHTQADSILYEAVCNMPMWTPARYENGVPVKQDYVLLVGNMDNCAINTINISNEM